MYVQARLVEGVQHQAILAPQQGVTHDAHGDAVALVLGRDGKVEQRKLTLGAAQGDKWVVEAGSRPATS
jgi:membrane fusion protein (multidrug efflux system)